MFYIRPIQLATFGPHVAYKGLMHGSQALIYLSLSPITPSARVSGVSPPSSSCHFLPLPQGVGPCRELRVSLGLNPRQRDHTCAGQQ